jgi:ABC-type lipoprotein export system ATPase subunit
LAGEPSLLLADEPTGNLDGKTGEMVMSLLEDLQTRKGLSFLYITHNPQFAARAHRVVHLEKGVAGAVISQQDQHPQHLSSQANLQISNPGSSGSGNLPMSEGGATHV